jgi:hypothetical protein
LHPWVYAPEDQGDERQQQGRTEPHKQVEVQQHRNRPDDEQDVLDELDHPLGDQPLDGLGVAEKAHQEPARSAPTGVLQGHLLQVDPHGVAHPGGHPLPNPARKGALLVQEVTPQQRSRRQKGDDHVVIQ